MDLDTNQKHISTDEKNQIESQVKADLIDHLYEGCLPGTFAGVAGSVAIFLVFYGYTATYLLIDWFVGFNSMLAILTGLYFGYVKYKNRLTLDTWERLYSSTMVGCALLWLPCLYLMPEVMTRQFLGLIGLFIVTTGYATGTIGQFRLCVSTLSLILLPLISWCFYRGGIFYNIIGAYCITYYIFMLGANYRSTIWFIDSLKLKLENTLVSYQANHDLLTGLPNQRLLPQLVESALKTLRNTSNNCALVCFSLNRMEMINDSFGHPAGDSIIQGVASRLSALATQLSDEKTKYFISISRKDTFNVLIVPLQPQEAEFKIRVLFSVLEDPFYLEQKEIKVTASIGVSFAPQNGEDTQALVANADAAMLQAKQFGGNCLEFYKAEINAQTPKKLEIETDLYEALKKKQFLLNYQPLVDLKTGKISGMEALIRWKHPVHGMISPLNFIPLAEETGLIVPIGTWVMEEACRQVKEWHEMGFSSLKVAVNLAEKQLRQENILEVIDGILQKTGFDHNFLELEITETAILDETIINLIKEFKNRGFSLSVDDFGTGYSGLSYLKRFSINKLKIDQSFIRDIPGSNDSITIVSAIIAMAKELQVNIVAEGVETIEQLNFLKEKGCDYVQGYYFSKPLEAAFFTQLLVKNKGMGMAESA